MNPPKNPLLPLIVFIVLALPAAASADTITFNFPGPFAGALGTSQAFTSGGVTITAYGFAGQGTTTSPGVATKLFAKTAGGDETGLGIDGAPHSEIQANNFVQLDMSNLWALNPTAFNLRIGSVQTTESWNIFGSNTLGTRGTLLLGPGTTDFPNYFSVNPVPLSYRYITVQAATADVLLDNVQATVTPEPATMLLLGTGLAGVAAKVRRRRSQARRG